MIDEGIKSVLSNKDDQRACRQLMKVICESYMYKDLSPPQKNSWDDRVREWYREKRDCLVFEPKTQRFVNASRESEARKVQNKNNLLP